MTISIGRIIADKAAERQPDLQRSRQERGTQGRLDAGIDVSFELSSVCIVDAKGKIVKEAKVPSDPDALVAFLAVLAFQLLGSGLKLDRCRSGCMPD